MSLRQQTQAGFTLMETVIAMMIMIGALIVIGNSWSGNLMRIEKARMNSNLALLLERKMTEIDLEYRGKPLTEIKEEDGGEFEGPYANYRWEMRSREFEMPDLSGLIGARNEGNSKNNEIAALIAKTVSEYMKTAVKEVTVSIIYQSQKGKKKEIRQSISTYFMDYTKPLSLSGLPAGLGG